MPSNKSDEIKNYCNNVRSGCTGWAIVSEFINRTLGN